MCDLQSLLADVIRIGERVGGAGEDHILKEGRSELKLSKMREMLDRKMTNEYK
jgi:hypothetical protein